MIFLTRKAEFSSAHFYWNDDWSAEENQRIFGKCANRNGHGHNYTLEVTVSGEIDPISGFVVDLKELKDILEREVDHREHCHRDLESTGEQDSQCEAAPGADLRDAGFVCGLLW